MSRNEMRRSMEKERWKKIEEIYHATLEQPVSERDVFLKDACGVDSDLHAEVESLLSNHENEDKFLSEPLLSSGLALVNELPRKFADGDHIEQYKIRELVARGGMGDVYLADDTKLDRPVALKVLHATTTSQNIYRFEREARTASGIAHPNVAHIYDVGRFDGASYIAMEFIDGVSLRTLLRSEKLSTSKAIWIARQTANALSAAHATGVIHRDIKPENIMLREGRFVKLIDFGLAKTANVALASGSGSSESVQTLPGMIMGTVGYMSPEQVRGHELDPRSDIWSLGVVLYEMLIGERPFQGDSSIDTLSSILKEDPPLLDDPSINVHPLATKIIQRCLQKKPEDRFQTAADLAFALDSFDVGSNAQTAIVADDVDLIFNFFRRAALPALAIFVTAMLAYVFYSFSKPLFETKNATVFRQLTFDRGTIWSARFGPDGNSIVYNAAWNDDALDLYSLSPPNIEARRLDFPNTSLLSVSSKGEAAVLIDKKYLYQFIHRGTLARMSVEGGAMREVAEDVQEADWAPDGETLAIVRWVGNQNRLEYPIDKILYERSGYLSYPRVSNDGERIAFFEHATQWDNRGDVSLVDREGRRQVVSKDWNGLEGLAWRGDEIWFTGSKRGEAFALYSVRPGENERLVSSVPVNLMLHDISPAGKVLLSRAIQQTDVYLNKPQTTDVDLSWLHLIGPSDLSADGTTFLFTHFGEGSGVNYAVYLRKTDGSPAVRLGDGRALALSPDKRFALAKLNEPYGLILHPVKAGAVITLPKGNIESYDRAGWFPDNERIIFTGNEIGKPKRSFVQSILTNEMIGLTPEGFAGTQLSPDATMLVVKDQRGQKNIFTLKNGEILRIKGLEDDEEIVRWTADGRSLIVYRPYDIPIKVYKLDLADGKKELVREIIPGNRTGVFGNIYFFTTPDANVFLYGLRRYLFDLYIAEGLD